MTESHIYDKVTQKINSQAVSGLLERQMLLLIQGQIRNFSQKYASHIERGKTDLITAYNCITTLCLSLYTEVIK